MRFFHPSAPADRAARDLLLTRALRSEWAPFPIASEYPIVLSEAGVTTSYCLTDAGKILAHANLWPRDMLDHSTQQKIRIGLVGNVATDAAHRGQGVMRRLLDELKRVATYSGLEALILWSDLLEFYQKQGFSSCGQERRYLLHTRNLPASTGWHRAVPSPAMLQRHLSQRYPTPTTLMRTVAEFQTLLTIPGCDFRQTDSGYVIMGKGVDMLGVAHEWGASDPESLLGGVRMAAEANGYDECMLLTPATIDDEWHRKLSSFASNIESHPMALMWTPNATDPITKSIIESSFIWGLDSI